MIYGAFDSLFACGLVHASAWIGLLVGQKSPKLGRNILSKLFRLFGRVRRRHHEDHISICEEGKVLMCIYMCLFAVS